MRLFVISQLPDRCSSSGAAVQCHQEQWPGEVQHRRNAWVCKPNLWFLLEQRDCKFNLHCWTKHYISLSSLTDGSMSFLWITLFITNTVVKYPIACAVTALMLQSFSLCVLILGSCRCQQAGTWWRAHQGKFCQMPCHSKVLRKDPVWV